MKRPGVKTSGILILLLLLLLAGFLFSMHVGMYPIRPSEVFELIRVRLTGGKTGIDESTQQVFYNWRLPRLAAAMLIGGALSVSGASYQGIMRNPIVAPDILGAGSGACFGAALGLLLGWNAFFVQLLAFCFGLAAVGISFFVSNSVGGEGRGGVLMLVLAGMVVTALFSAGISIIKYVGDPYSTLPAITFWLMGGLSAVSGRDVLVLLIPFVIGVVPLMLLRWKMNILCFEDEEAGALGSNVRLLRAVIILCATLLTCSSVAVAGMVGWVGLIIPHICRMVTGPDHRKLLPVSLLAGALFLMLVDDIARCIIAQELPLGILTALIGAPVFLVLLYRGKRSFSS